MTILVTGAAGFIGSHLAERLAASGQTVIGIDCLSDYYSRSLKELNMRQLQQQGITMLPLDLASDDLHAALRDVTLIYHLAAQPGLSATTSFEIYVRNNLTATHRLLEVAQQLPALRGFINISTSSVYGADATGSEETVAQPCSHYGVTKLAAEQLVLAAARDQGFPACSLRLFSVYGPRERPDKLYPQLIRCIFADQPFPLYEGSEHHQRSFTYVGDIVAGIISAAHHIDQCVGEIFNIGTDTAITTGEGMRIVEEIIGKPVRIERKPRRPGDQFRTHANIAKARRVLDYNPSTTPREGLAQMVEWYRQNILGKLEL